MLRKIAGLLLIICLTASPVWAGELAIVVGAERTVTGPLLTLGDIADITGDDQARTDRLRSLPLGSAPKPGGRLVLTREMLGARLAASGGDFSGATWQIPDAVVIRTAAQAVSGLQLEAAAVAALKKQINLDEAKLEIAAVDQPAEIQVPLGKVTLKAEVPYGIRKGTPTPVNIEVYVDGRWYTRATPRFYIKIFEDIVVAAKPINVNETLTAEKLAYRRTDVAGMSGYITDVRALAGLAAKRYLAPGAAVSRTDVTKPVLVKRGSTVVIAASAGAIAVTAAGLALQDGAEGQIIRVQNIASKRILAAKVVAGDRVEAVTLQ
ncbi:MAG: flagellar basal body P-ring formation chaperone FlgA [Negativicutes bacterium]|nr:flagellar basal body P-ring formation chaperone FlgA [Negativicutes bacterium]